jgi:predicted nucleotidyltransferase
MVRRMLKAGGLRSVLDAIRAHAGELKRRGVRHASVFGSLARGEHGKASDIDILLSLDPKSAVDAFAFSGIILDLQAWIGRPVDVARRDKLPSRIRARALKDEIRAF